MSTFDRLHNFDQELLDQIYKTGSVDFKIGDFNLISINVNSTNPNDALISIPIQYDVYSIDAAQKILDFEFREFVDNDEETVDEELQTILSTGLESHKDKIIELRILAGQGNSFSDFSDEFPYEALETYKDA